MIFSNAKVIAVVVVAGIGAGVSPSSAAPVLVQPATMLTEQKTPVLHIRYGRWYGAGYRGWGYRGYRGWGAAAAGAVVGGAIARSAYYGTYSPYGGGYPYADGYAYGGGYASDYCSPYGYGGYYPRYIQHYPYGW